MSHIHQHHMTAPAPAGGVAITFTPDHGIQFFIN